LSTKGYKATEINQNIPVKEKTNQKSKKDNKAIKNGTLVYRFMFFIEKYVNIIKYGIHARVYSSNIV
jgi:hypothetical protein